MIIILEGVNGTGKSTCASILKNGLGIQICRPFRFGDSDIHWGSNGKEKYDKLVSMKIPINTHVDDLYAADFLAAFQVDAILDRPLTSGIAYGRAFKQMDGWYKEKGVSRALLDFWMEMIGNCKPPLLYVWMTASYDIVKKRCTGRWCPISKEFTALHKEYERIFHRMRLPKMRINTDDISAERCVKKILEKV